MATQIPHLSLPLRVGTGGSFEAVEQDTIEDVAQCVGVIVQTPIGSREELPGFGMPRIEFSTVLPMVPILQAIYTWEPRAAAVVRSAITPPGTDPLSWDLEVVVGR